MTLRYLVKSLVLTLLVVNTVATASAQTRNASSGHRNQLRVAVSGPQDVGLAQRNSDKCTYEAHPAGGRPPYKYQWYLSGQGRAGTRKTHQAHGRWLGNQWVRVVVTDSAGNSADSGEYQIIVHERLELQPDGNVNPEFGNWLLGIHFINDSEVTITPQTLNVQSETFTVSVKVGVSATGAIGAAEIAAKLETLVERTTSASQSIQLDFTLNPGDAIYYWKRSVVNLTTGTAKRWGVCGLEVEGSYENRHDKNVGYQFTSKPAPPPN